MTTDQKTTNVLSKIKEIKLLSLEMQELLKNSAVKKAVMNKLNCDPNALIDELDKVIAELDAIPSRTEDGIVICSELEKARREAFKVNTRKNNEARKQFYSDERNVGSVGRERKFRF